MITSERNQNIFVAGMIITGLVCSAFLVSNAMHYSGSYALASGIQVTMDTPVVGNLDVGNDSIYPYVRFSFNLESRSPFEGNVRITFMGAQVALNDDLLSYTSFARVVPYDQQPVHQNQNWSVVLSRTTDTDEDRQTIIDAYNLGIWNWTVVFRYSFIVFDEPGSISWSYRSFETTEVVIL